MTDTSRWDAAYAAEEYAYGTEPNGFLAESAARIPLGPVLCLADGEGRNGAYLAGLGHPVTSVDGSARAGEKARALAGARGVDIHTVHADLSAFVIEPGAWAGIVSIFCHLPPDLRARVHAASVRGLRPGGAFVLEAYTPDQLALGTGGPPVPELLMRADVLRRELDGLDLQTCREVRRSVVEGSRHRGEGAVVQVVGVKPYIPAP
jgi:SAM-dependent methyltransferase